VALLFFRASLWASVPADTLFFRQKCEFRINFEQTDGKIKKNLNKWLQ